MPTWNVTVPEANVVVDNVVASVWGNGNNGKDAWGLSYAPLSATVLGQVVTLTSSVQGDGSTKYAAILRYTASTKTGESDKVFATMVLLE